MPGEIHVSDVGTRYYCRVRDRGGDFDPSGADVKLLRFLLPDGVTVVEKPATVESEVVEGQTRWYLVYYAEAGFHANPGDMKLQGQITYGDGRQWFSDIRTRDDDQEPLTVHANL